jgi:hypothetical protein
MLLHALLVVIHILIRNQMKMYKRPIRQLGKQQKSIL